MKLLLLFLGVIGISLASPVERPEYGPPEGRIVNGTDTSIELYPYMVSLRGRSLSHSCGGVAIHPFWILTAAHCTQSQAEGAYNIRHSSTTLLNQIDEKVIQIAEVINHENYNPSNRYINDISLLRLETPINIVNFAILPNQFDDLAQDTPATLIGWGLNETGGYIQNILQRVDLIIFSDEECRKRHDENFLPHPSNICGGVPEGGKGQCSGDSGGPLISSGVTVGIVSWSVKPCTVYPYPGVYTQVSYYREWIRQRTGI